MKTWQVLVLGIFLGLIVAGLILLLAGPPRGVPVQLIPPPTQALFVVHIDGAVTRPGIYPLTPGSRVGDAIQAAGGLRADADVNAINLAAPLHDGMKIQVFCQGEKATPPETSLVSVTAPAAETAIPIQYPLNLNLATQVELESLPGIGATRAQAIIAYREEHGPFTRIEDIQNVEGIGPGLFGKMRELITVETNP